MSECTKQDTECCIKNNLQEEEIKKFVSKTIEALDKGKERVKDAKISFG